MSTFLEAKTPAEVVERRWSVPVGDDSASSASVSASVVTVGSYSLEGDELVLKISGGSAGNAGVITATITTSQGQALIETLYIPVVNSPSQIANTARDYVHFALRKVIGIGEEADADELADGLLRLSAIIAEWRESGADIGAPFPLTANSIIYCPDYAVNALRYNLLLDCASIYEYEPSAREIEHARRGLQLVKHKNLPDDRGGVEYF